MSHPAKALRWGRWLSCAAMLVAAVLPAGGARAYVAQPVDTVILLSDAHEPPASAGEWQPARLPDNWWQSRPESPRTASWYRMHFELPETALDEGPLALYLPYLYDGGVVYLNGEVLGFVRVSSHGTTVRWRGPHLMRARDGLARTGSNEVMVRVPSSDSVSAPRFPRPSFGTEDALRTDHARRVFWVRTIPEFSAGSCFVVSFFVLFIWWRRRSETLYGLVGVAALLWGLRTLNFIVEEVPAAYWLAWRMLYHAATGGFIVMLALFSLRFAGYRKPWIERGLLVYWLIGPAYLLIVGTAADPQLNRGWTAGMLPVGVLLGAMLLVAAWRQRTWQALLLFSALVIGVLAGVHDYFVTWAHPVLVRIAPDWVGQRIFLLHPAADLLLLAMAAIMTARFAETLEAFETLNRTLEQRIAERESQLAHNFAAMAEHGRERAIADERQRIMRDMHDGLGSRLFTSLSRVERGAMSQPQMASALRSCIDEMRLALDTLAQPDTDFRSAFGNFRYRWEAQLAAAGIASAWELDATVDKPDLSPPQRLQVLHILQEALTNVLKHACARQVTLRMSGSGNTIVFEIVDDGQGLPTCAPTGGRGVDNMRTRAQRLGGTLVMESGDLGTRVVLTMPASTPIRLVEPLRQRA